MTESTPALGLQGECTIVQAAAAREELLAQLAAAPEGTSLAIDLHAVTEFDSAGVQLLLALRRSLLDSGRTLTLHAPSEAVRLALRTYHLAADDLAPVGP